MADLFGSIIDSINQDKGFMYGLANNAISYAQSRSAQKRAFEYAKQLQTHQFDLNMQSVYRTPQNLRNGLELAGINPMLATGSFGNASSVAGGTPVSANAADSPDLSGSALDMQRLSNETEQTNSNVEMNNATSFKAKMEGISAFIKNNFLPKREEEEIKNIQSQTVKATAESNYIDAQKDAIDKRLELDYELGLMDLEGRKYNADTNLSGIKYSADKGLEGVQTSTDTSTKNALINTILPTLFMLALSPQGRLLKSNLFKGASNLTKSINKVPSYMRKPIGLPNSYNTSIQRRNLYKNSGFKYHNFSTKYH